MTDTLSTFPRSRCENAASRRFFARTMRFEAPANANAPRRAVLFDMSLCFGAMPVVCGPLEIVRRQRDLIAATGEGWYSDMPREIRAMLKLNRASLRLVEIDFDLGDWPELDALIADLFERSGLPPAEALKRMERLVALLDRLRGHLGPLPGAAGHA